MPFGMVSGVGRRMGVLHGGGDRRRAVLEVNLAFLGRHIVTIWGLATPLLPNYFGQGLFNIKHSKSGLAVVSACSLSPKLLKISPRFWSNPSADRDKQNRIFNPAENGGFGRAATRLAGD